MVVATSSLKSMSFPVMTLDDFYGNRHELPPNKWSLNPIRQLLVTPNTDYALWVDCYYSSQYLQIDKDNFILLLDLFYYLFMGVLHGTPIPLTHLCVYMVAHRRQKRTF